jgi:hypothetical protein
MLIYTNCFRIDLLKSYNNNYIVLGNGIIVDTSTNIAYTVSNPKILKVYGRTSYIYYNVSTKLFETSVTEYDINTIEELYPNLCPIIKVNVDSSNIVDYQYYVLGIGTSVVAPTPMIPTNNVSAKTEVVQVRLNTITIDTVILGIINIYVHNYGDLELTDVGITDYYNVTLPDYTLDGLTVNLTYLYQNVTL